MFILFIHINKYYTFLFFCRINESITHYFLTVFIVHFFFSSVERFFLSLTFDPMIKKVSKRLLPSLSTFRCVWILILCRQSFRSLPKHLAVNFSIPTVLLSLDRSRTGHSLQSIYSTCSRNFFLFVVNKTPHQQTVLI